MNHICHICVVMNNIHTVTYYTLLIHCCRGTIRDLWNVGKSASILLCKNWCALLLGFNDTRELNKRKKTLKRRILSLCEYSVSFCHLFTYS
jgi:hypothetical protein